jgi:hypothetical protein
MELIERYLKTLKSGLPDERKEDIARELSENIYSEIEEKEAELGRVVTQEEVKELLKRHGNPLVVASRYRQDQRSLAFGKQLIGPTLFPFYLKVLSFNLGLTAVIILVIFTGLLAGGKTVGVGGGLSILFWNLLIQFAVITAIFTAMEQYAAKYPDRWDVGRGTPLQLRGMDEVAGAAARISRSSSFSQIVGLAVSIVWLRAIQTHPFLIFGPAAAFMRLAPVWFQVYPAVVFIYMVLMVQAAINFARPDWVRLPHVARAMTSVMWLVLYWFLFRAGTWVVATSDASPGYQRGIAIANQVIFFCLIGAVVITVGMLVNALRRAFGGVAGGGARKAAVNH